MNRSRGIYSEFGSSNGEMEKILSKNSEFKFILEYLSSEYFYKEDLYRI